MGRHRATSASEKENRRQAILDAASSLFERWSFEDITMDRMAEAAGLSKGALYLYFASKESIFLELFERLLMDWHLAVDRELEDADYGITIPRAAGILTRSLGARPRLLRLYALLHPILEGNIDVATATGLLERRRNRIKVTASRMASTISGVTAGRAFDFLVLLDPIITGFAQTWIAAPAVARALEAEHLAGLKIDSERQILRTLTALLGYSAAGAGSTRD